MTSEHKKVMSRGQLMGGAGGRGSSLSSETGGRDDPDPREAVERRAAWYRERLAYWKQWEPGADLAWADFMKR